MIETDLEVLRMCATIFAWERGAWVNVCVEFLQETGFIKRGTTELTEKGWDAVADPNKYLERKKT